MNCTILALFGIAFAGCAGTQADPKTVATVCAMHQDAATVAAVNATTGLSAKEIAEKQLALDLFCATQGAAPPK